MSAPPPMSAAEGYRRALACLDDGDEVAARRAVEEGLAHAWQPRAAAARECLDDLGSQLDGEAALHRFAARTPGPRAWLARPDDLARAVLGLQRAHLVEAVIEEISMLLPPRVLLRLIGALGRCGTAPARDLLAAFAVVMPGGVAQEARRRWGGAEPSSPAARALTRPSIAGAWRGRADAVHDQQQIILAVSRDHGRVAPLVALVDRPHGDPLLRDAFFLPDMVPGRLEREVLWPLSSAGMAVAPDDARVALDAASAALAAALAAGRQIPSEAHQCVIARMLRLQAALGAPRGPDVAGDPADVG